MRSRFLTCAVLAAVMTAGLGMSASAEAAMQFSPQLLAQAQTEKLGSFPLTLSASQSSDVAIDKAGRVLVVGFSASSAAPEVVVERYVDGDLDSTFVADAIAASALDDVSIQTDYVGDVVVRSGSELHKLSPAGKLDSSFGSDGTLKLEGDLRDWKAGRQIVVGLERADHAIVERYSSEGNLLDDAVLGPPHTADVSLEHISARQGKVTVFASTTDEGGRQHRMLARFEEGALDHSFGINGYLFDLGLLADGATLQENADGLYMGAPAGDGLDAAMSAVRFTQDGLPDVSWGPASFPGVDGRFGVYAPNALAYSAQGITTLLDGQMLVAGKAVLGGSDTVELFVVAYDEQGAIKADFGVAGMLGLMDTRGTEDASILDLAARSGRAVALVRASGELRVIMIQ